jgi:pimeloyl-ACP methyl ester carboxylesterase
MPKMTASDSGTVLLVHGLWMNAFAMRPLARRLEHCGFQVKRHGYKSVTRGLRENARGLAAACENVHKGDARLHLVGHSLGGVLIMAMLQEHPEIQVHRVVLIGAPYAGSSAAHGLAHFGWSRTVLGQTIEDWRRRARAPVPQGIEVGVIAGSVSFGLGRLFVNLPEPNDGVVMLSETRVPEATASIVLRTSHSAMLVSAAVARATCAFLKSGSFKT